MHTEKNTRYIFLLLLEILKIICNVLLLKMGEGLWTNDWLFFVSIIIVLNILIDLYVLRLCKIKILSMTGIFISFTYLFHFGQVILNGIFKNHEYKYANMLKLYNFSYVKKSVPFMIITLSAVLIGVVISSYGKIKTEDSGPVQTIDLSFVRTLGWIILIITFPLKIKYDIDALVTSSISGYNDTLHMSYSGIYIQISLFYIIGFILLLIGYKDCKNKAKMILTLELIYLCLTMISGGRIYQTISICLIMFFYLNCVEKINIKSFIIYAALGYLLLKVLTVISIVRANNTGSFKVIANAFFSLKNDPISSALEEFGSTIQTMIVTIIKIPLVQDFQNGKTYLLSFSGALVNINGSIDEIITKANFVKNLNTKGIGGSYIAELYYNFGNYSYIIAVVIGFIVNKVSNTINRLVTKRSFDKLAYYIMPFYYTIMWVRGSFIDFSRAIIWGIVFIWSINIFVKKVFFKNRELYNCSIENIK